MIEAFQKKDINAIDEFVKANDSSLKIKTEDLKAYMRYLKEILLTTNNYCLIYRKRQ